MTEIEHKQRIAADLEEGNQRSYQELQEKYPGFRMDTADMRRELLIEQLVEWGVITEEQKLDFDILFHKNVEEALDGAWEQVRAQQKEEHKKHLTVAKAPTKLVDGHGRPLT